MKSMTGYSNLIFENDDFKVKIEIKTVNNKYVSVNIKQSYILNFLENKIKTLLSKYVKRGSVNLRIDFEDKRENSELLEYDKQLAKSYFKILKKVEKDFDEKLDSKLDVLIKHPSIIKKKDQIVDENLYTNFVLNQVEEVLKKLNVAREEEGSRLKEYFYKSIEIFQANLEEIKSFKEKVVEDYREKLMKRLNEIDEKISFSQEDILKEILLFADRSDITEEVTRLESHLVQFKQELENELIGKKIDFILQEMFREMNTTGVKANSYEISKRVVEGKAELEKMREQVQNIE